MTDRQVRAMTQGFDPVGMLAAADLLEEQGQDEGAVVWRRRGEWGSRFTAWLTGAAPAVLSERPGWEQVPLSSRWSLHVRRTGQRVRFLLQDRSPPLAARRRTAASGWMDSGRLGDDAYRRTRLFGLVEAALRWERADGAPAFDEGLAARTLMAWLATLGYLVKSVPASGMEVAGLIAVEGRIQIAIDAQGVVHVRRDWDEVTGTFRRSAFAPHAVRLLVEIDAALRLVASRRTGGAG